MRHPVSTDKVSALKPGDQLDGGAVVLETGRIHPDGEGSFAWRVCALIIPDKEYQPFVVWNVYYDDERERWSCESGDYAMTISGALERFAARTGQKELV